MLKIEKTNNLEEIDENSDVIEMWQPLEFEVDSEYQYVNNNIIFKILSDALFYLVAAPVVYFISKVILGFKIEGEENLEKIDNISAISVSNHIHILDCAMIGLAFLPKRIYYTASDASFKMPIIRHIVKLLNALPISNNLTCKKKLLNTIDELLKQDETIVHVYPEASLWPYYDKIRKFKNGAFEMAVRNDVPIIPMLFSYREVTGIRKYIKTKPFITLKILEPIYANKTLSKKEQVEDLKQRVSEAMK